MKRLQRWNITLDGLTRFLARLLKPRRINSCIRSVNHSAYALKLSRKRHSQPFLPLVTLAQPNIAGGTTHCVCWHGN